MKLHHIAIWVDDLDKIRDYYMRYFDARSNEIYVNTTTGFKSYFLSFQSGSQIEIMHRADIAENRNNTIDQYRGYIHTSFIVNSKEEVDAKAEELRNAGYPILRGPRITGDGYYEFETLDPEGNRLEVMY